ncbi:MAG TPA: response regulator transcription factor [Abditibacteriaceae bacterium]|nr:response regulator transcription factor [Abditibacteriaceae bacterium]
MSNELVLVVDDEAGITDFVSYNLEQAGYRARVESTGKGALKSVNEEVPALVVLDLMLPDLSGFEVCKALRAKEATSRVPIIMLTARDDEVDKVVGLELGADDYVTKPFSPRELVARVGAVLRRQGESGGEATSHPQSGTFRSGDVVLDTARRIVTKSGEEMPINPKEYAILELLMKARGAALSRDRILDVVWAGDFYGDARQLDVYIYRLREKLGEGVIETARGYGYRIKSEG